MITCWVAGVKQTIGKVSSSASCYFVYNIITVRKTTLNTCSLNRVCPIFRMFLLHFTGNTLKSPNSCCFCVLLHVMRRSQYPTLHFTFSRGTRFISRVRCVTSHSMTFWISLELDSLLFNLSIKNVYFSELEITMFFVLSEKFTLL